jgi:hypothetical protein
LQIGKKYLLEFTMLFFAVFLGFLADGYREIQNEKANEKEYVNSLVSDVGSDKLSLKTAIQENKVQKNNLDTLSSLSSNYHLQHRKSWELYKYLSAPLSKPSFLNPNELTFSQLKNAGGLRLIKNKKMIEKIYRYDQSKQKLINQQFYYETYQNKAIATAGKIFNIQKFLSVPAGKPNNNSVNINPNEFELIQNNEILLKEFANDITMFSVIVAYYIVLLEETNKETDSLITVAKKEYKIK